VPVVRADTPMNDVIYEMSKKGFGITAVASADGELARCHLRWRSAPLTAAGRARRPQEAAGECMKRDPVTISAGELASAALQIMEERKITSLFSVDDARRVEGIIHIHDLWGLELF
jgi:arabinose-5-phosphate isomerase